MLALKASGSGTLASCISSRQMWRCSGVQSWPPHSTGQCGTASPAALSTRWVSTYCSLATCRWAATVSRISCGTCVVKKVRISSRKASSSGDSCNRIGPHFLTAAALAEDSAVSTCPPTIPHPVPAGSSGPDLPPRPCHPLPRPVVPDPALQGEVGHHTVRSHGAVGAAVRGRAAAPV